MLITFPFILNFCNISEGFSFFFFFVLPFFLMHVLLLFLKMLFIVRSCCQRHYLRILNTQILIFKEKELLHTVVKLPSQKNVKRVRSSHQKQELFEQNGMRRWVTTLPGNKGCRTICPISYNKPHQVTGCDCSVAEPVWVCLDLVTI